jgi:hypothetical protein
MSWRSRQGQNSLRRVSMPSRFTASRYQETTLLPFTPDISKGRAGLLSSFVQTAFDQSRSDLAARYFTSPRSLRRNFQRAESKGIYEVAEVLPEDSEWLDFLLDCREILILNQRASHFLKGLFLHESMGSAMAFPMFHKGTISDIVILNSRHENHYGSQNSRNLQQLSAICSNLLK